LDFSYDLTVSLIHAKSSHVHKGTTYGSLFTVLSHGELYQMRATYVFIYGLCNWSALKVKVANCYSLHAKTSKHTTIHF